MIGVVKLKQQITILKSTINMDTYKTFLRSFTNWESFAKARKMAQDTGLSYDEARERCKYYNDNRTPRQIKKGTKMEFTRE
jgi:hypothetical protein